MKSIRNKAERFCASRPGFGIPRLILFMVLGSAVVWLISKFNTSGSVLSALYFRPDLILRGQIWRLISWAFIPNNSQLIWVAIELYFYYFIGSTLENIWGEGLFTIYYFSGIILNILMGFAFYFCFGGICILTPYYLNLSMFFAFATLFPEQRVLLFFFIPIKVKWLAVADAILIAYSAAMSIYYGSWMYAILPVIAIANYLLFCWQDLRYNLKRSRAGNINNTINFRKAKKEIQQQEAKQRAANYRHKCCVCGKTDTDYPELEYRYCSLCQGYHCFCQEHINNHVHFKE